MIRVRQLQRMLMATVVMAPVLGCAPQAPLIPTSAPTSVETTASYKALRNLPAPANPVPVAVYSYPDLTGQLKPTETVSTNSRAVTQGAVWMLMKSLKDAGGGRWFKVIQRANLDHLLKERQIIRETRGRFQKQTGQAQPELPSLLFAGIILEGGIIGYDTNTISGGIGARYLGIGGDVQYRQDTVTVYLNAISSQTGEILKSVMTRKTVASYGVRGSVFKFVAFQKLLEGETGYTVNEPSQIAVAQSIEHAVRAMIIEGALEGLWNFEDQLAGKEETQLYLAEKEDDLLLGDADTAVAQALLTEEQISKLARARETKSRRLAQQASQEASIKPAAHSLPSGDANAPSTHRQKAKKPSGASRFPNVPKATPISQQSPDPAKSTEDQTLQQMIDAIKSLKHTGSWNDGRLSLPNQQQATKRLHAAALTALNKVFAEFNAETKRMLSRPTIQVRELQSSLSEPASLQLVANGKGVMMPASMTISIPERPSANKL